MRDYKGAIPFLELAIEYDQTSAAARYNLGIAYEASGLDRFAESAYQATTALAPNNAIPYVNLGGIAYRKGDPLQGRKYHDKALSIETTDPDELGQRSFIRMLRGDYALGFKEYECRWQSAMVKSTNYRPMQGRRWNGQTIKDGGLLVFAEQGIGDTVMMLRYLPKLLELGIPLTFMVPPSAVKLVQASVPTRVKVVGTAAFLPSFRTAWNVPMMSLPGVFGTTVKTIPRATGFLRNPGKLLPNELAGPRLRPLIGFVESGNAGHMNDHDRSIPKALRGQLETEESADWLPLSHTECFFKQRHVGDLADLVSLCDAVVSVDTAAAHIAASLGIPTLMLPPSSPEWRWGEPPEHETITPARWYPDTMQLLWRKDTNDWPSVISRAKSWVEARAWE
jgi:hypothetical protein